MIDGVNGFVNLAFCASGRTMHVSSNTSNTGGQSVSHASQTMQPGAIQTLMISSWVSAMFKYQVG
jgi:hypothetical protein